MLMTCIHRLVRRMTAAWGVNCANDEYRPWIQPEYEMSILFAAASVNIPYKNYYFRAFAEEDLHVIKGPSHYIKIFQKIIDSEPESGHPLITFTCDFTDQGCFGPSGKTTDDGAAAHTINVDANQAIINICPNFKLSPATKDLECDWGHERNLAAYWSRGEFIFIQIRSSSDRIVYVNTRLT